jgi:small conductance mechanosensitive channel
MDSIGTSTEAMEVLSDAQAGLQEVAENPGIIRTWLEGLVPDLLNFALQVVIALVVYVIGGKIIKLILKMLSRGMERRGTDEGVKQFLLPLVKYSLYVILIFIIMGLFGIATTSAVAVLGSAGVAVGLALQGSLSNFAGGVLILLLKPFRVGDYIVEHSGGKEGTVTEISIFYTKLLSADNKMILVPNGTLANCTVTNVSGMEKRRVDVEVGIAYEADIRTAKEVLKKVAAEDEARLKEEEPVVFVDSLGDSSVNMGVRIWVAAENYWSTKWRLTENVKYALDEAGISIPYPQMDVQIKQ